MALSVEHTPSSGVILDFAPSAKNVARPTSPHAPHAIALTGRPWARRRCAKTSTRRERPDRGGVPAPEENKQNQSSG